MPMHLTGSLFPEDWPKNAPVTVTFTPISGMGALRFGGTITVHLGDGDLEATHASLLAAADALRLFLNERDLTVEEQEALAAGVAA